jgi:hypothetical protein
MQHTLICCNAEESYDKMFLDVGLDQWDDKLVGPFTQINTYGFLYKRPSKVIDQNE